MKRLITVLANSVLLSLLVIPLAGAAERCLSTFSDNEWLSGTPVAVKSLLGFDLVEKVTKTPEAVTLPIHPYFIFGEYTEVTTYKYVGKNCTSRDVVISKVIDEQSITYGFQTLSELIGARAPNFLIQENSVKYYASIREYFARKTFKVSKKQLLSQDVDSGSTRGIQMALLAENTKFQGGAVWPNWAFISFPSKCAYWYKSDENGENTKEKIFAGSVGRYTSSGFLYFASNGECIAELREGGNSNVAEKIADIKYVVKVNGTTTLTCIKGKLIKKVTAINPKCPAGYGRKAIKLS